MDIRLPTNISPPRLVETSAMKFPSKLWKLVNRCTSGTVGWGSSGKTIRIYKRRFENDFLKRGINIFKTDKYNSFVRQLNLYGFRKVTLGLRYFHDKDNPQFDYSEYQHPWFQYGHPEYLPYIQRRLKQGSSQDTENYQSRNGGDNMFTQTILPNGKQDTFLQSQVIDSPLLQPPKKISKSEISKSPYSRSYLPLVNPSCVASDPYPWTPYAAGDTGRSQMSECCTHALHDGLKSSILNPSYPALGSATKQHSLMEGDENVPQLRENTFLTQVNQGISSMVLPAIPGSFTETISVSDINEQMTDVKVGPMSLQDIKQWNLQIPVITSGTQLYDTLTSSYGTSDVSPDSTVTISPRAGNENGAMTVTNPTMASSLLMEVVRNYQESVLNASSGVQNYVVTILPVNCNTTEVASSLTDALQQTIVADNTLMGDQSTTLIQVDAEGTPAVIVETMHDAMYMPQEMMEDNGQIHDYLDQTGSDIMGKSSAVEDCSRRVEQ